MANSENFWITWKLVLFYSKFHIWKNICSCHSLTIVTFSDILVQAKTSEIVFGSASNSNLQGLGVVQKDCLRVLESSNALGSSVLRWRQEQGQEHLPSDSDAARERWPMLQRCLETWTILLEIVASSPVPDDLLERVGINLLNTPDSVKSNIMGNTPFHHHGSMAPICWNHGVGGGDVLEVQR